MQGIIGNYLVERELGRGGMGVVYGARHRVLGRPAAIKVLLANTGERARVERFFNEARAAMAIDHPGVVKMFDVGLDADDRPYIAMELLDGESLATLLARGPLPVRRAVDFACQIADALSAAHEAGVIHRDLKPENIIVAQGGGRIIIVDFGIARLAHVATVRTATGALIGTPLYMSPEQCEGLRELDARADLYAFGCVLFAMLTGRPPFDTGGPGGVIGAHLHVPPPLLRTRCPAASEALERIVAVLLANAPDGRFRTARAALAALAAPEARGLAAAPGVAATADVVPSGSAPFSASPAYAAPSPSSPHARTAAPPHVSSSASSDAPPPARRRRGAIVVLVASSCAIIAIVAIVIARSSSAPPMHADAAVVAVVPDAALAPIDAAVAQVVVDAAVALPRPIDAAPVASAPPRTAPPRAGSGVSRTTPRTTPRVAMGSAAPPVETPMPAPEREPAPEPPPVQRVEIHQRVPFYKGDFTVAGADAVLDRIAAAHRADPSRRIIITGHAEQDEPGVLATLAGARANAVLVHLTNRRVPRSAMVINATRYIDPVTPNGANRRADIDFE